MILDDLVHKQLVATAKLAQAAVASGLLDVAMFYFPGDAPYVARRDLQPQIEICTDGDGTFDVWAVETEPARIIKTGLPLADAVAVLGGAERQQ